MKLIVLIVLPILLCSCAMRVHVCFETESTRICESCKKKPIISYRPVDDRPEKPIKIIDLPFVSAEYAS